jgi:hypothetical protein
MIRKVRNRAIPTSTWVGGVCCVLNAFLTKPRTIIILVKEVNKIIIDGAKDKTVSSISICNAELRVLGSADWVTASVIFGIDIIF